MQRRQFIQLGLAGLVATSSACFGSFKATRWVYDLNKGISGNKFVRWLVFLGLVILPVYEIAALIDVWILNSLEFWFGGGATAQNEGDERTVALGDGRTMTLRKDVERGILTTIITDGAKVTEFALEMGDSGARVLGAQGDVASARIAADGGIDVLAAGVVVAHHDPAEVDALDRAYASGDNVAVAAFAQRDATIAVR